MVVKNKEKKERDALIRKFVQRICTPTTAEKRLHAIQQFLDASKRIVFSDVEGQQLWKGLFYALWYTEMGKGCEQIIQAIAKACTVRVDLLMAGFRCLTIEWSGIDAIRLDKFQHFARHMLRAAIRFDLSESDGPKGKTIRDMLNITEDCLGLLYHYTDIYLGELFSAIDQIDFGQDRKEKSRLLHRMLAVFVPLLLTSDDQRTLKTVQHDIFKEAATSLEQDRFSLRRYLIRMKRALIARGSRPEVNQRNRLFVYATAELLQKKLAQLEQGKNGTHHQPKSIRSH